MEEWRDIIGYEGYYQVSNIGNVRSLDRIIPTKAGYSRLRKGRFLSLLDCNGYVVVNLSIENRSKIHYVHRLVLSSFTLYSKLEINHIDGDKKNNIISNLEYVTKKENQNHALDTGLLKRDSRGRFTTPR
jgi:hypothetical protein